MNYKKMYCIMFNAATDAVRSIDAGEYERFIFALF